jgi:uncharacterized protein
VRIGLTESRFQLPLKPIVPRQTEYMKTHPVLAFIVSFSLTPAFCQAPAQPPMITVSGSAEVKVAPDEIYLRVGVEKRDENLDAAKRQTDESVSKALAFLKSSGVSSKDVQTDYISIEPSYGDSSLRTKPLHYSIRRAIQVKLTKLDTFEAVLTGLLTNGVNTVQGIEFRTSELRKHRDTARAMAIRAAKEKADAMASELGAKRGKVYNISANDWGGWWSPSGGYWGGRYGVNAFQNAVQSVGGAPETDDSALSIGQISVSASVNVSFLIE